MPPRLMGFSEGVIDINKRINMQTEPFYKMQTGPVYKMDRVFFLHFSSSLFFPFMVTYTSASWLNKQIKKAAKV